MPFLFAYVCDLLEKLELPFLHEVGFLPGTLREYLRKHTSHWFTQHCARLDAFATDDKAVLSMLRPYHQTDRVYGLDPESLELVIARALSLTRFEYLELQKWKADPLGRDLAFFVEQLMKDSKINPSSVKNNKVTIEDIDQVLLQIASYHPESSPEVRSLAETWRDANHVLLLGDLYRSLQPREAKWLTRLILKTLEPLIFPDDLELSASSGHSHLPKCLQVSIKLQPGGAGAVRRDGPMMVRGHAPTPTSTVSVKTPIQAGTSAKRSAISFPPTPLTSSITLPTGKPASETLVALSSAGRLFPKSLPTGASITPASRAGEGTASNLFLASLSAPPVPQTFPITPNSATPVSATLETVRPSKSPLHILKPIFEKPDKSISPTKARRSSRIALGEVSSNTTSNSQASQPQSTLQGPPLHFVSGTGKCKFSRNRCPLTNCIFILSPCIVSDLYITDTLLHSHGSSYLNSISAINHPSLRRRCSVTGKHYTKIVLVEPNATKPTSKFLKQIGRLIMRKEGKKEWLRVYDWRLLESLAKADQGKVLSHDPWARMLIGRI